MTNGGLLLVIFRIIGPHMTNETAPNASPYAILVISLPVFQKKSTNMTNIVLFGQNPGSHWSFRIPINMK